jgi:DNA-binding transcriptional ArsR family regulator
MRDAARALETLESVFTALAHPARRQILLTIHYWGGAMTAGDIARRFEHSWPTTTRHLQVLEDAGLIAHERLGRERRYALVPARFDVIREWVGHFDAAPHTTQLEHEPRRSKSA